MVVTADARISVASELHWLCAGFDCVLDCYPIVLNLTSRIPDPFRWNLGMGHSYSLAGQSQCSGKKVRRVLAESLRNSSKVRRIHVSLSLSLRSNHAERDNHRIMAEEGFIVRLENSWNVF
jgi:hypothetical protein